MAGEPAFDLGSSCGTCAFFFERLDGAKQKISACGISDQLQQGLAEIPGELLESIVQLLLAEPYIVNLLQVNLRKIGIWETNNDKQGNL